MQIPIIAIDDEPANFGMIETALATMPPIAFGEASIATTFHAIHVAKTGGRLDLERVVESAARLMPGVAVIDMRLEGDDASDFSGLDVAMRLKASRPDCCIILRSAYFHETAESELFRHLELIRYAIESPSTAELQRVLRGALLSHASSAYYRRRRFQQLVNGDMPDMWALVIGKGRSGLRLNKHVPLPQLRADTVVVQPIEIGVCGTNRASLGLTPAREYDLVDFHEAFGRVVWAGEHVRTLKVGDYVVPMVRRCTPWDAPNADSGGAAWSFAVHQCDHKTRDCYRHPEVCPVGEYGGVTPSGERVGYKSFGTGKCHGFGSQYFTDAEDWLIRIDPPTDEPFRGRMMGRYVLTEPLSIVWKARREILRHYQLKEYDDRVLIVGLGPIGLLAALVMRRMHPGLRLTAVDLANPNSKRAQAVVGLGNVEYYQAHHRDEAPAAVHDRQFEIIIEATDDPDRIIKYGTDLLAPSGIIVLLGVSEELGTVDLRSKAVTQFVKRNNILIGSINSARRDFVESVSFMERIIGDEESLLETMVSRWDISSNLADALQQFGKADRTTREDIKIVLNAGRYSTQRLEEVVQQRAPLL